MAATAAARGRCGVADDLGCVDLGGERRRRRRALGDLGADGRAGSLPPGRRPARAATSARAWNAGKQVVAARRRRPRARRAARRRRRRVRRARRGRHARARPGARAAARSGCSITPFGLDGPARGVARVRPRRDGREREHVLHRRSRPGAGALHRAHRVRAHRGRGRVRGADRAGSGRPQRVDVSMQEVVLVANMVAPGRFPKTGYRGRAPGREHRPHARDLADARRLRVVRAARRQGAGREPRDPHQARRRRRHPRRRARRARTGRPSTRTPRPTRSSPRSRPRSPSTSPRHTMQELYDIACETNLMLAPANSPREIYAVGAARGARLLRPGRRRRRASRARSSSSRSADGEVAPRRGRYRRARAVDRRASTPPAARTGRAGPAGVGRRAASSSSARARPGRSRRATSSSTARPCCAIESQTPARLPARLRAGGPTTRTASRARRCTTGSTSASATSRST